MPELTSFPVCGHVRLYMTLFAEKYLLYYTNIPHILHGFAYSSVIAPDIYTSLPTLLCSWGKSFLNHQLKIFTMLKQEAC